MQKEDKNLLIFATIVCVTCSLILSAASSVLRNRQEQNVEVDRRINVLQAFGEPVKDNNGKKIVTADEVNRTFDKHIEEIILDAQTGEVLDATASAAVTPEEKTKKTKLPLYRWRENGKVTRYAIPISGPGLWGKIYGYLALDKDLATVLGATFYKHIETPGLGAECSRPWFQNNFKGLVLWKNGKLQDFKVVKGKAPEGSKTQVDGISGATITGNGITSFVNEDMHLYNIYFSKVRGS